MWFTSLLITIALATLVACTPVTSVFAKRDGRHLTTGIETRAGGGHPYIRREIHDLKNNNPESWSLYILGLHAFHQTDQNDPLSYYQISGIHSKPWKPWQDANGAENPGGHGYCPHNNMMFAPWHRPYVVLFEQELYKHVRSVAEQATTDQRRWIMAADAFRQPYWDWALGHNGGDFPDFFSTPSITVNGPNGEQTIPNPLYQYAFHPVSIDDFDDDWGQLNTTLRCPASHEAGVQSQNQVVSQTFSNARRLWHDDIARSFEKSLDFNDFAKRVQGAHGGPHVTIGGFMPARGHMWIFDYSAFDPIFMLVHANVDRIFALYQAAHPEQWMEPISSGAYGNFWIPKRSTLDANMQMQPFWKDEKSFYTPNDIRNTSIFGYAYPETQYWKYASDEEWRAAVNSSIALQYSSSARAMLKSGKQDGSSLTHLLKDNSFIDWTINIKASTLDMPPIFQMMFSLSDPSSLDLSMEVGSWLYQMSGHRDELELEQKIEGSIGLTSSLLDQIATDKLRSLDANDVMSYLKTHLTWKIITGDVIHVENKPNSLVIEAVSTQVRIPDDPTQRLEYRDETTSYPVAMQKD
ncbi:Di-copper centre-containing protein [Massarina eburnea CBS 473.64]|uniref:tyrosinase n=1 Tax=Massarina eburnea CBS 473.64 TaxID=1395130 RepID=A0A6A6RQ29_9PLEO|nr:Di-copper centre-containing protein [Massarina eburnea CBS 473.64]